MTAPSGLSLLIFLASPYTHQDEAVELWRYNAVCKKAADLISSGFIVFSPIAHSHGIAVCGSLETGFEYWSRINMHMLKKSDELWVYKLLGYDRSAGVKYEIGMAGMLDMPIKYIDWSENNQ